MDAHNPVLAGLIRKRQGGVRVEVESAETAQLPRAGPSNRSVDPSLGLGPKGRAYRAKAEARMDRRQRLPIRYFVSGRQGLLNCAWFLFAVMRAIGVHTLRVGDWS